MLSDSCAYFPVWLSHNNLFTHFDHSSEQKTWPDVVGEVLVKKGWTPKKEPRTQVGQVEEDLPSLGDKPAALALGRPASLPACSLVTLSTMKSVETSEVCSRQARRRERTKEVHFLDTTTDRGADLSHHRTGFDKCQISMFPYISAIKEVF